MVALLLLPFNRRYEELKQIAEDYMQKKMERILVLRTESEIPALWDRERIIEGEKAIRKELEI